MSLPTTPLPSAEAEQRNRPPVSRQVSTSRRAIGVVLERPSDNAIDRKATELAQRLREEGADLNGSKPAWFADYERAADREGAIAPHLAQEYQGYTWADFNRLIVLVRSFLDGPDPSRPRRPVL